MHIWEVAPGPGVEALEALDPSVSLDTLELLHLITPRVQIIDGVIESYDEKEGLILLIRAVDSTSWDIETEDIELLEALQRVYPDGSVMEA